MLAEQIVQVAFDGGLDEGTQSQLVPPPKLSEATNVVWRKRNSIEKRYGYAPIGTAATPVGAHRIVKRKSELLLVDSNQSGNAIWAYSEDRNRWIQKDRSPECGIERRPILANTGGLVSSGVAIANGYEFRSWISKDDNSLYVHVMELDTGTVVLGPLQLRGATCTKTKMVADGTTAYVFYSTSAKVIYARTISVATPSAVSAETTISDATFTGTSTVWDVVLRSADVLTLWEEVAVPQIRIQTRTLALATPTYANILIGGPASPLNAISADGITGEDLWVVYAEAAATRFFRLSRVNPATGAQSIVIAIVATALSVPWSLIAVTRSSTTAAYFIASEPGFHTIFGQMTTAAGGTITWSSSASWTELVVAPFIRTGKTFAVLSPINASASGLDRSNAYVVVDLLTDFSTGAGSFTPRPVAIAAPRITPAATEVRRAINVGSSYFFDGLVNADNAGRNSLWRFEIDFDDPEHAFPAELAGVTSLSTGCVYQWDGTRLSEHGFVYTPKIQTVNTVVGPIPAGTYRYKITYAWVDGEGRLHESSPSEEVVVAPVGAWQGQFLVRCLSLTNRESYNPFGTQTYQPIYILLYRTAAGGGTFYRVTQVPFAAANKNIVNAPTIVLPQDTMLDAVLQTQPQLYTEGDVLDRVCPPGLRGLIAHQGRLWGIDETRRAIWFTDEDIPPEAIGWHDDFTIPSPDGHDLTALAALDEKLIIFQAGAIYRVTGFGPIRTGVGSSLSTPELVSADSGCVDPRSIVRIPQGLMYLDPARGLMLLTRALETFWIGEDIQGELVTYPVITSATLIPAEHLAIFTACVSQHSGSGVFLVFDYQRERWATWRISGASTGTPTAIEHEGKHTFWGTDGPWRQDRSTHRDNATSFVALNVTTAPFSVAGVQGWQRVWRVGLKAASNSAHGLTVQITTDELDTVTSTWTEADITALTLEQVRVSPKNQRSAALAVRIVDTPPASSADNGKGPTLIALSLRVGVLRGTRQRLAAGAKR